MTAWSTIADHLSRRQSVALPGLGGSSPSWLLDRVVRELPGPLLWVVPDGSEALRRRSELDFFGGDDALEVQLLSDWDVTPYKGYSPSAGVVRSRMVALDALASQRPCVVLAPVAALSKRVLSPSALAAATEHLAVGTELQRESLLERLVECGYLSTDAVVESGSFAVRGGILDLWPAGSASPYRVEFWGDEVDSIRSFDPWTQRSVETVEQVRVLPARELVLRQAQRDRLPEALKTLASDRALPPRRRIQLQREFSEGTVLQEQELYLPLFDPGLVTVFDYLGPGGVLCWEQPEAIRSQQMGRHSELRELWGAHEGFERLLPEPGDLFVDEDEIDAAVRGCPRLVLPELHAEGDEDEDEENPLATIRFEAPDHRDLRLEVLAARESAEGMLDPLVKRLEDWRGRDCEVQVVGRRKEGEQLAALLEPYGVAVDFRPGDLRAGFRLLDEGLVVVSAQEILGPPKKRSKSTRRPTGHEAIGSLAQLARGDLVVHALHGIGRYEGLVKLRLDAGAAEVAAEQRARAEDPGYVPGSGGRPGQGRGSNNDYLQLVYRGDDRLYLPVHKLGQLARYVAAGGPNPRLDKLGGQTWSKRRKKVSEAVQKVAKQLLELYARRSVARSEAYVAPDSFYREFCAGFPFEETPDQQAAIDAVLRDMVSDRPMDRLVCGDVGFGKTEVALRATFLAVAQGRQVAVLVPTTVLALQHHQAFQERLEPFAARVEMLSRFRTAGEQKKTLKALAEGKVDVVVGTHRLLSRDVSFKQLGLLVVDEEHRFGVTHKERIKQLRHQVDVLTLTATPIPRTLQMSLAGLRDFSPIVTPPEGRQAVRTSVARFSNRRIVDAVRFELGRGGQVFFVHNRVKTIWQVADYLGRMLPEVRIRVAHGQMSEKRLEGIMLDFFQRRFDLLLCTTIIESGLDVPSANTMIIHRAERLGLAQLHQLRGRVGRGLEQAFCLMLVPPGRSLSTRSLERLRVIQEHSELGSGHRIAQHDLEIRGAGNLLGARQSGHIADVGLVTYMELLEGAVRDLQGKPADVGPEPEVDLRSDAWIPADYVPDERDRIAEYKRLCDVRDTEELKDRFDELEDRYGRPPKEVLAFEKLIEAKTLCKRLRIRNLKMARGGRMELHFDASTPVDPGTLLGQLQEGDRKCSFRTDGALLLSLDKEERRRPVEVAVRLLHRLVDDLAAPS